MTHEQALRQAMKRLIDVLAVRGIGKEVRDRRESEIQDAWLEGVAALSLPVPEVTLEYRVLHEVLCCAGINQHWSKKAAVCESRMRAEQRHETHLKSPAFYRNSVIESRVAAGPWLPVVQP